VVHPKGERQVLEGVRHQLQGEESSSSSRSGSSNEYSQDDEWQGESGGNGGNGGGGGGGGKAPPEYIWSIRTPRSLVVDLRDNQHDRRGDRFLEQLIDVSTAFKNYGSGGVGGGGVGGCGGRPTTTAPAASGDVGIVKVRRW